MPQEFDAQTGNIITQQEPRADPLAPAAHRAAVATADGTAKPAPAAGLWAQNPGNRSRCRVFVETTGQPASCTVRPYLRCGGATGHVGAAALQTLNGSPNYDLSFDVQCDGDDLLIYVEGLSGGTTPTVSVYLSWR